MNHIVDTCPLTKFEGVLNLLHEADLVIWRLQHSRNKLFLMVVDLSVHCESMGGSVAEWLACWTQAQKARVQIAVATLSGNSLTQTADTHCASVDQVAKLVAAVLRVAGVTAGLAESNGSLPPAL